MKMFCNDFDLPFLVDIRASLIQAAQRKVLKQCVQPATIVPTTTPIHNTYVSFSLEFIMSMFDLYDENFVV